MGETDSDRLYNELANIRKEFENINSRIDLLENKINELQIQDEVRKTEDILGKLGTRLVNKEISDQTYNDLKNKYTRKVSELKNKVAEVKKIPQKISAEEIVSETAAKELEKKIEVKEKEEKLLDYRDWISGRTKEEPQVTEVKKPQVAELEEPQVAELEEPQVTELEKIPVFEEKKEPFFDWKKISFEEDIGKKWFSRIGIISIFIAMVLLLKDLYDRNLISPAAKIGIGIIMGLILLAAGEILNKKQYEKKYEYLARTITSGGIGILYLTIYSGDVLYHLIRPEIDMILLGLIVVFAVMISLRYSSKVLASEAFFLGYIIPFIIISITAYTLGFITILTIGLVIVVRRMGWINIGIGGLIAVYAIHFTWFLSHNSTEYFITNVVFLSIYFIIFTVLSHSIHGVEEHASLKDFKSIFREVPGRYESILITSMNAVFYYFALYLIFNKNYDKFTALSTVIVALAYLCLSYAALKKNAKGLLAIYLTLCMILITLAIPLQFNHEQVTIAWALEGFVLLLIGFHCSSPGIKEAGNIIGIITFVKTLFIDTRLSAFNIQSPTESSRFFAFLIPIIIFYAISVIYFKNKDKIESESKFWEYYFGGGTLLTTVLLMLELKAEWVTIAWALEGFILLLIGFRYSERIRMFGNIVGIITISKALIFDTRLSAFNIQSITESSRFFALLIPIIIFYAISVIYFKNKDKTEYESKFWEYYFGGGTLLTTVLFMLELKGGLISAAWTIQAIAILITGFRYRLSFVRKLGLGLFSITIVKVFIFDFAGLEKLYRIISFMVLGVILLIASFVYSKYKDKL